MRVSVLFNTSTAFMLARAQMPEGFCSWAWRDLYKDLAVLRHGGNFEQWVEPPYMYTSRSDGIRPVSFKLEILKD